MNLLFHSFSEHWIYLSIAGSGWISDIRAFKWIGQIPDEGGSLRANIVPLVADQHRRDEIVVGTEFVRRQLPGRTTRRRVLNIAENHVEEFMWKPIDGDGDGVVSEPLKLRHS